MDFFIKQRIVPPRASISAMKASSGAVFTELAIILPILFTLLFAIFDMAYTIRVTNVVTEAARHGARSAIGRRPAPLVCGDFTEVDAQAPQLLDCDDLPDVLNPITSSALQTATHSSCQFLTLAGFRAEDWRAAASFTTINFADLNGLPPPPPPPSRGSIVLNLTITPLFSCTLCLSSLVGFSPQQTLQFQYCRTE